MATKELTRPRTTTVATGRKAAAPVKSAAPPNLVSTDGVLALQQTAGNAAVQRALALQRDDLASPPSDNPVVGLKRQDGLDFGTTDRRPRVKLLQAKLNEKVGSGLSVDGMWGKKTSGSLESFQLGRSTVPAESVDQDTGDALMDRKETPKPVPKPAASFNPVLESRLEAVLVGYQLIFSRQKDAISRLESDLADLDKPDESIFLKLLRKAVDLVMGKFIDLTLSDLIKAVVAIGGLLKPEQQTAATDGALGKAKEAVKGGLDKAFAEPPAREVDIFIDSQLEGATSASADVQEAFLINTKPAMTKIQDGDVVTEDESDTRVARAEALREKVRKVRFDSFDSQYNESLSQWTVYLAQKPPGKGKDDPANVTAGGGTDLSKTKAVPGILDIDMDIDPDDASKPARVKGLEIKGLSEKARKRLKSADRSLGSLGFPMIAERTKIIGTDVKIARNEKDEVFDRKSNRDGRKWLLDKVRAENNEVPPDGAITVDLANGIRSTFAELDTTRTSQIEIEKG